MVIIPILYFAVIHAANGECWWSGCQPKIWAQRGCFPEAQWKNVGSKPCPGGNQFHCCSPDMEKTADNEVESGDCWWSGCQPKTWAQRGCFPEKQWKIAETKSCPSGDQYRCCKRGGGGGGSPTKKPSGKPVTPKPDEGHGKLPLTWMEFRRAVTDNGYPAPEQMQYKAMIGQAAHAGQIASKQELAMFLAQILWESGGLKYKREIACVHTGCPGAYDTSVGIPGKSYYGRGYIQLTHSYNYKAASMDLYGDLRLINDPDMVADNEDVAWATAFWYWRTRVRSAPNVLNFHFGATTNAINGALECRGGYQNKAKKRFEVYKKVLTAFNLHVNPIESGCYN